MGHWRLSFATSFLFAQVASHPPGVEKCVYRGSVGPCVWGEAEHAHLCGSHGHAEDGPS